MIICLRDPSKISRETTGFPRRGQAANYVLFNTGNNPTRETKTKDEEVVEPRPHVKTKKVHISTTKKFKKTKITRETAARPGR